MLLANAAGAKYRRIYHARDHIMKLIFRTRTADRSVWCRSPFSGCIGAVAMATLSLISMAAPAAAVTWQKAAVWHMNESSGSKMLDAVGGHTGTLKNVLLGRSGFQGGAYGFTGTSYVTVPHASNLNAANRSMRITIHMRAMKKPPNSVEDWDLIRSGYYSKSAGLFKMEYYPSGQASCGFKGTGAAKYLEILAGPSLADNKWHTIQCVKLPNTIQLIVDGKSFTKSGVIGSMQNSDPIDIGAHDRVSEFFQGTLDEAVIEFASP